MVRKGLINIMLCCFLISCGGKALDGGVQKACDWDIEQKNWYFLSCTSYRENKVNRIYNGYELSGYVLGEIDCEKSSIVIEKAVLKMCFTYGKFDEIHSLYKPRYLIVYDQEGLYLEINGLNDFGKTVKVTAGNRSINYIDLVIPHLYFLNQEVVKSCAEDKKHGEVVRDEHKNNGRTKYSTYNLDTFNKYFSVCVEDYSNNDFYSDKTFLHVVDGSNLNYRNKLSDGNLELSKILFDNSLSFSIATLENYLEAIFIECKNNERGLV